jgi:hypothetical protein
MGVWSDRVVQLTITIDGPWHASSAALMACGAGGMALLSGLLLLVVRSFARRRRKLQLTALD